MFPFNKKKEVAANPISLNKESFFNRGLVVADLAEQIFRDLISRSDVYNDPKECAKQAFHFAVEFEREKQRFFDIRERAAGYENS